MKKCWDGVVVMGSSEVGSFHAEYETSQPWRPQNVNMCCPKCGDNWAKLTMPFAKSWAVMVAPCQDCGGGVLWLHFGKHTQKTPFKMSKEILERDFMVLSGMVIDKLPLHEHTKLRLL